MSENSSFPFPSLSDAAAFLKEGGLNSLSENKKEFAASLLKAFDVGKMSDKQAFWLRRLAVLAKKASDPASSPFLLENEWSLPNAKNIFALFKFASAKLKYPKVVLTIPSQDPLPVKAIQIYPAGKLSKYYGSLSVVSEGKYPYRKWFGVIDPAGVFEASPYFESLPQSSKEQIVLLLSLFGENPASLAAKQGKLLGNCCFCGLPLEDESSVSAGYGPVCAENYGLPWGGKIAKSFLSAMEANPPAAVPVSENQPKEKASAVAPEEPVLVAAPRAKEYLF
jgi:hypothetical protein